MSYEVKKVTPQYFMSNICRNKEERLLWSTAADRKFSIGSHHKGLKNWMRISRFFTRKEDGVLGFYVTFLPDGHYSIEKDEMIWDEIPEDVWENIPKLAESLVAEYSSCKVPVDVKVLNGNKDGHPRFGKPVAISIACNRFINQEWEKKEG